MNFPNQLAKKKEKPSPPRQVSFEGKCQCFGLGFWVEQQI